MVVPSASLHWPHAMSMFEGALEVFFSILLCPNQQGTLHRIVVGGQYRRSHVLLNRSQLCRSASYVPRWCNGCKIVVVSRRLQVWGNSNPHALQELCSGEAPLGPPQHILTHIWGS